MTLATLDKTEIQTKLRDGVCTVVFTKKNGDERVMECTLREDMLPAQVVSEDTETKTKKPNPDVLAVYDVKAEGWRSFRWDSVKAFSF